jgi:hypothetical protein
MLIALLISATAAPSALPKQLGYPIFVQGSADQCAYVIQDMVMHDDGQFRDWMQGRTLKLRVDIVINDKSPKSCVDRAKAVIKEAGYSDVVVRHGSEADYGWTGPPR